MVDMKQQALKSRRPKPVAVMVAVQSSYLSQFEQVLDRCKQVGLRVSQALQSIGIIDGTIPPTKIPKLTEVEGVSAVERSQTYTVAPPSSDIQ
jgi:hypothetical protein